VNKQASKTDAQSKAHTKCDGRDEWCLVNLSWQALGRVRAFSPMHVAAHLCLLGFGARPLSQPPAFCDPTRKQGNRELVLEGDCRVPFSVSCILETCEKEMSMEKFL